MKTILIIEDDENLSRGIAFSFEKDGYMVMCAICPIENVYLLWKV